MGGGDGEPANHVREAGARAGRGSRRTSSAAVGVWATSTRPSEVGGSPIAAVATSARWRWRGSGSRGLALDPGAAVPTAPEAIEIVPIKTFSREHSLHETTVRQMAKEGRVEATKIGKRQWRVRRDSPIGQPMARGATSMDSPAERARRLVEKLK
jgi:hypothetical protein